MENAVVDLLADVAAWGIELESCGDRLRYRPASAVTPVLLERLQTHRWELLAALRTPEIVNAANAGGGSLVLLR